MNAMRALVMPALLAARLEATQNRKQIQRNICVHELEFRSDDNEIFDAFQAGRFAPRRVFERLTFMKA